MKHTERMQMTHQLGRGEWLAQLHEMAEPEAQLALYAMLWTLRDYDGMSAMQQARS